MIKLISVLDSVQIDDLIYLRCANENKEFYQHEVISSQQNAQLLDSPKNIKNSMENVSIERMKM